MRTTTIKSRKTKLRATEEDITRVLTSLYSEYLLLNRIAETVRDMPFGESIALPWCRESFPRLDQAMREWEHFKLSGSFSFLKHRDIPDMVSGPHNNREVSMKKATKVKAAKKVVKKASKSKAAPAKKTKAVKKAKPVKKAAKPAKKIAKRVTKKVAKKSIKTAKKPVKKAVKKVIKKAVKAKPVKKAVKKPENAQKNIPVIS